MWDVRTRGSPQWACKKLLSDNYKPSYENETQLQCVKKNKLNFHIFVIVNKSPRETKTHNEFQTTLQTL